MLLTDDTVPTNVTTAFAPDVVMKRDTLTLRPPGESVVPAVLAQTSGTTGSSKFVMLTQSNLDANCRAIRLSLPVHQSDVACLVLSPVYSYGLSVVNTHLAQGATLYVPAAMFGSRTFWYEINAALVTSVALTPSHLDILSASANFEDQLPATLRYVTVAGGRVTQRGHNALVRLKNKGVQVYVMYGQTEATARITCLNDADYLLCKNAVGQPVDGVLSIDPTTHEIVYRGPNVFAGYATCRRDLCYTDPPTDVLHTGDLGYIDPDNGYLYVTGRLKRTAKINSVQVSLDELETLLETAHSVKCVSDDEWIYVCSPAPPDLTNYPTLAPRIKHVTVDVVPLLPNGKTDYVALEKIAFNGQTFAPQPT